LGNMIMDTGSEEIFLGRDYGHTRTASEELSSTVDREVKKIIDNAYETAKKILTDNMDKLELIAKTLIEKERIEKEEFDILMDGGELPEETAGETANETAPEAPASAEEPVKTEESSEQ
ncbi:MAG: ATP-dependent zinc metalloprotease FtsH, partial [Clostridia bacterium]|nr:ATP-dependent zinc metalloprotease FtsH [Clostridia bacterium]